MKNYWINYKLKPYIQGWFRRIFWHWGSRRKLISIRTIKRSDYRDIDSILVEVVFELLRKYVENEHSGIEELKRWTKQLEDDAKDESRVCHEDEKYLLSHQAEEQHKMIRWYEHIINRENRPDPWDENFDGYEYIDKDGNPTNDRGAKLQSDGLIRMNETSPEFKEHLDKCSTIEQKHYEDDTKIAMEILENRRILWT
jgi:hypothetical protein